MIIRLRSRDGLERIEVDDHATVAGLKLAINQKLHIPMEQLQLSTNAQLLTSKTPEQIQDMADSFTGLKSLGIRHGDMVYMLYNFERQVDPGYKKHVLESRKFGETFTVEAIMAKQTRIERQDKATVAAVSFDAQAANVFQSYIQGAYSFSIKRGGIMYGSVDDEGVVRVDFIYEPPQKGTADALELERHGAEEQQVEFLAELLGLRKVGVIMSQSTKERDYIMNTGEIKLAASVQDEVGEKGVAVLVIYDEAEEGGQVHFEAFQCSQQCVRLWREGWIHEQEGEPSGVSRMVNPKEPDNKAPVMILTKDTDEVDNDYFLCPVAIQQHEGKLLTNFPIENRLLPQGKSELKDHLRKLGSKDYRDKLSDMHLLLWLARQPNLEPHDMMIMCEAIRHKKPMPEGYRFIIDSIAGL